MATRGIGGAGKAGPKNEITALPELPTSLNNLTELPALPESLTHLHLNNNDLTELPALPEGLTHLHSVASLCAWGFMMFFLFRGHALL